MKILTTSFLTCAVKSCRSSPASFPLYFRDASLEKTSIPYNGQFLLNILPRIDWSALQTTAAELGLSAMLPDSNPQDALLAAEEKPGGMDVEEDSGKEKGGVSEEVLKRLWTLLMETVVVEGKLICGNCGFEYPVKEGVGNFLLPPHLV